MAPLFLYGEKYENFITDYSVWACYYDILRISPMSEYAFSIPMIWLGTFLGNIFLDVMCLSQKDKRKLHVEREVAFRDANTEINAAKQVDW